MDSVAVIVREASQVGEARRLATVMAGRLGLDEQDRGRIALVINEAAGNLIKHGGGGQVVITPVERAQVGLEMLFLDKGGGIADVERAMRDGYSTAGTRGGGLGAIARMSDAFDVWSAPGQGTAVLSRIYRGKAAARPELEFEAAAVCVPKAGEVACGDGWAFEEVAGRALLAVVDGLGHGPDAAKAARAALEVFSLEAGRSTPAAIVQQAHAALRSTRGAALAVLQLDRAAREVRVASIGNVAGAVIDGEVSKRMVAQNGTVGHTLPRVQEQAYPWPVGSLLAVHTDGIATHWDLSKYPGLWLRDGAVIAGVIFRDHVRGRDDATLVCIRERKR